MEKGLLSTGSYSYKNIDSDDMSATQFQRKRNDSEGNIRKMAKHNHPLPRRESLNDSSDSNGVNPGSEALIRLESNSYTSSRPAMDAEPYHNQISHAQRSSKSTYLPKCIKKWSTRSLYLSEHEKYVIMICAALFIICTVIGIKSAMVLLDQTNNGTPVDAKLFDENSAFYVYGYRSLVYPEVVLDIISLISSLAVVLLFAVSADFRLYSLPFVFPLFVADTMHWLIRFLQVAFMILQNHYEKCVAFATAANFFYLASTIWIPAVAINMCVGLRSTTLEKENWKVHLWNHLIVWGLATLFTIEITHKYWEHTLTIPREGQNLFCSMPSASTTKFGVVSTVAIALSAVVFFLLRNRINNSYPNGAKIRVRRLISGLIIFFIVSRAPLCGFSLYRSSGYEIYKVTEYVGNVLFHLGGMLCAVVVIFDFFARKVVGEGVIDLRTIDGDRVTVLDPKEILYQTNYYAVFKGKWNLKTVGLKAYSRHITGRAPLGDQHTIDMIKQEALRSSELNHPSILRTYGLCFLDAQIYIVLEYCKSQTLETILWGLDADGVDLETGIRLTYTDIVFVAVQIAKALRYLHSRKPKMTFRYLSPRTVLVSPNLTVKLFDFQMARVVSPIENLRQVVSTADGAGASIHLTNSMYCIAPELMVPGALYTTATDVYSFGMMLWQMFTGSVAPFEKKTESAVIEALVQGHRPELIEAIPNTMRTLITLCWRPDPSQRPSIDVVIDVLKADFFKRATFERIDQRRREVSLVDGESTMNGSTL